MAESTNWAFPTEYQPKQSECRFDLAAALDSVVQVRAGIPEDAFTANMLGTERIGNGVVIHENGLVLTIGYLITEAETIWLTTNDGDAVAGHPIAYDQATGFGLVMPLGTLDLPVLPRGSIDRCEVGDDLVVIGHGGRGHALKANVIAKREFAGYWEYVLDEAIFTAPAHPQWGGAAFVDGDGHLLGIGSLLVQETVQETTRQGDKEKSVEGNMMVPIDLLDPILDAMLKTGRAAGPVRGWLGLYAQESDGQLVVGGLARGAPAERAGVKVGDRVVEVSGRPVTKLAELFRAVWHLGPAGTEVPLTLARADQRVTVKLRSADRADFLKKPRLH